MALFPMVTGGGTAEIADIIWDPDYPYAITFTKSYSLVIVVGSDNVTGSTLSYTGSGTELNGWHFMYTWAKAIKNVSSGDRVTLNYSAGHTYAVTAYCFS